MYPEAQSAVTYRSSRTTVNAVAAGDDTHRPRLPVWLIPTSRWSSGHAALRAPASQSPPARIRRDATWSAWSSDSIDQVVAAGGIGRCDRGASTSRDHAADRQSSPSNRPIR